MPVERLKNFIDGQWVDSNAAATHEVRNPATGEALAHVPLCGADDVRKAAEAAQRAFPAWRATPSVERARYLFEFKHLLEKHFEEIASTVTREHGKTLPESRGSVRRGIECVEVAAGAPSLLMGQVLEDVARGIDCESVRQPLGVFACIAPFNFPAMVPLWFYPFALVCGNTFIVKPSEQVPLSTVMMFDLLKETGIPDGVINLVHGGKDAVNGIIEEELIKGVSFVGSSPVAEHVYRESAARGKRVQALGGAKNFMIVMPDADMDSSLDAISESAYGCAGQRCLAGSVVLAVGDAHERVREGLVQRARGVKIGDGSKADSKMGPVISAQSKQRVEDYIEKGVAEGAKLVVDGREAPRDNDAGYFVGATLFDEVTPEMAIARDEIFGPVLCISKVSDLDEAMRVMHAHPLANATSIFTTSGKHARKFKYESSASMTGVNIGVAAPMSFFGFGGAKGSFFGDLKAHGRESFDFYTDRKVVISRWN